MIRNELASLLQRASRFLIRRYMARLAYSSRHPNRPGSGKIARAYGYDFGCGCRVFGYSAEAPARLRGPGLDKVWADELAAWPNLGAEEKEDAWSLLAPTLRESESPRIVVTTTPKPIKLLTDIIERKGTHLQQGATWDNTALSPEVIALIRDTYRGRIDEEQELEGRLLTESPFALWKQSDIELAERLGGVPRAELGRVVVAVDPSISAGGFAAECGIVICGQVKDSERLVVVDDLSGRMDPEVWGQAVYNACPCLRLSCFGRG